MDVQPATSWHVPDNDPDTTEQVTLGGETVDEDRPVSSEWI